MKSTLHSPSGRFFSFDSQTQSIAIGSGDTILLSCPWERFLLFSNQRPWNFVTGTAWKLEASQDDGALRLDFVSAECSGQLSLSFSGEALSCELQMTFAKDAICSFVALSLPIPDDAVLTMPGNLYNNNPSTDASRLVPRFPSSGPASLLLEESRLPIPGINAEYDGSAVSLFTLPHPEDPREWTLGFHRETAGGTRMMLSSGALSFCGEKDLFYAGKLRTAPILEPYRDYRGGEQLSHCFALSWGAVQSKGQGFSDLAQSGYRIFAPQPAPALSLEKVMELKLAALHERWGWHGYWNVLPGNLYKSPSIYLYGWTGQSFRLALCDLRDAVWNGRTDGIQRAMECVRFFLDGSATAVPGLRNNRFNPMLETDKRWGGDEDAQGRTIHSSRALGETWSDLARILCFCRENGLEEPDGALEALTEGLRFFLEHRLPEGVPPMMWFDDGTPASPELTGAGSSILPAFFDLWKLTGEEYWKEQAETMLDSFWEMGGDQFKTPFSHATLDAACEDKESGIPVFNAALKAWKLTGKEKYRRIAEVIGDWLLTWVCFTNLPLKKGSICERKQFRTVGWPTVSIENQHLDVFFPAWEFYEFGRDAGIERFEQMGKVVFAAWSHGISQGGGDWMFQNPGRQCEQFFHTNWCFNLTDRLHTFAEPIRFYMEQDGATDQNIAELYFKGGANPWDVSWIIALVLDAAQSFAHQ